MRRERNLLRTVKNSLSRLSFRTGVIVLLLCVPCYVISFAQMALNVSYTLKGILWAVFFGLAKTLQYSGLAIIGADGIKRLKSYFSKQKSENLNLDEET